MIPRVYDTCTDMLACGLCELRSNVSEVADVRFGETSSMLVALRMLMASSDSCLNGLLASHKYSQLAYMIANVGVYVLPHVDIPTGSVERHLDGGCCLSREVWRQSRLLWKEEK